MSLFGRIYADTELPHRARVVYMYLADRSDKSGKSWPGVNTIAQELGVSKSTVKRALNDLERAGYVERHARFRPNGSLTSNLYTILAR